MKPCCVCTIVGVAAGMILASYLVTSNSKVKDFVNKSKKAIGKNVKKIKNMGSNADN